jgi:hypothetical protein
MSTPKWACHWPPAQRLFGHRSVAMYERVTPNFPSNQRLRRNFLPPSPCSSRVQYRQVTSPTASVTTPVQSSLPHHCF